MHLLARLMLLGCRRQYKKVWHHCIMKYCTMNGFVGSSDAPGVPTVHEVWHHCYNIGHCDIMPKT